MWDCLGTEATDQYGNKITVFAGRYDVRCWPLIYQVDCRARKEHAPRVKRRLAREYKQALEEGRSHPYNPLRPWDLVWRTLTHSEHDWWQRELIEPCQWITANVMTVDRFLAGNHPVSSTTASVTTPSADTAAAPVIPQTKPLLALPAPPAGPDAEFKRGDVYIMKKSRRPLCKGFQAGTCAKLNAS